MERLRKFVLYNNGFVIILAGFFLITGGAMAASPDVRDSVFSSSQDLVSVDNSYLLNLNLNTYTPQVQITGVTEDSNYYYVAYTFQTVDVSNGAWQNVTDNRTMTVAKSDLGNEDLGTYVTQKLSDVVSAEMDRLRKTQALEEQNGETQKVVATTYGGLIGKFLNPTEDVLPGYVPTASTSVAAASLAINPPTTPTPPPPGAPSETPFSLAPSSGNSTSGALFVSVLGDNPVRVAMNTAYTDLGAVVTNANSQSVTFAYKVDGTSVSAVTLDTSTAGSHTITYIATDTAGDTGTATRTVLVYNPSTTVPDTTPPVITLNGPSVVNLNENDTFTDPGATANDSVDGDITSSITVVGTVDTTTPGSYTFTYWAQDSAGLRSSVVRTVNVAPGSGSSGGTTSTTTDESSSNTTTSSSTPDTSTASSTSSSDTTASSTPDTSTASSTSSSDSTDSSNSTASSSPDTSSDSTASSTSSS